MLGKSSSNPALIRPSAVLTAPGRYQYLPPKERAQRAALGEAIAPAVDRLLEKGERVLCHVPAQVPASLKAWMGLGLLTPRYHRTALVLTDRRLVEILLEPSRKKTATRQRSFAWLRAAKVGLSFGTLNLKKKVQPGSKDVSSYKWSGIPKADRSALKDLLERTLKEAPAHPAASNKTLPQWQCPACGTPIESVAAGCAHCRTPYRSRLLAAILSFCFPGAGFFYVRRGGLGTLTLLAEFLAIAVISAVLLLSGRVQENLPWLAAGAAAFFIIKLWSALASRFFAGRTIPIAPKHRWRWIAGACAGVAASIALLAAPVLHAGRFAPQVARDISFSNVNTSWRALRGAQARAALGGPENLRSLWVNDERGWRVQVRAYPLEPWKRFGRFEKELRTNPPWKSAAGSLLAGARPGGPRLAGMLVVPAKEGAVNLSYHYFYYDEEKNAVHEVVLEVPREEGNEARAALDGLTAHLEWLPVPAPATRAPVAAAGN